jgi:NADH-quinone oxidoreductase subunit L
MDWILTNLWLIPALPLLAAGLSALLKQRHRKAAAALAIGSMILALGLSLVAFINALQHTGGPSVETHRAFDFKWFQLSGATQLSDGWVRLGWVLDPLTAVMLVMVCFVGLLIFIYSVGYMAHDENFTRFFCFLALFAAAMLGVVIANSLLLLFICWELVGLTSYLLIGFWYHKPSAAAAAKKAFVTTRIGDLALLLGMVWLYSQTGSLLFYDDGHGCLELTALAKLVAQTTSLGMAASTGIALLIFCGAIGKSGQVPLHVWLPDAMEGPTPVSALIHAATMVAAGVFLVARVYPLMSANPGLAGVGGAVSGSSALTVVAWVGAITAVFAASIAVAQTDIKRILAYSTVSQLGFMMLGLGVGTAVAHGQVDAPAFGAAVGMFHLITHAFFKALLFLGAGSVIHGCHEEQDIRRMGGLRKYMPITFATYAAGMLALAGFPLFAGFWSKDQILHAAHLWHVSHWPFYLGIFGALLTAFYMTRQVCYVFFGQSRAGVPPASLHAPASHTGKAGRLFHVPHESPVEMTTPLVLLAVFAVLLGFIGTPAWPWFRDFLRGKPAPFEFGKLLESESLWLMGLSTAVVLTGIGLGWWLYGRKPILRAGEPDVLERLRPDIFALLRNKYFVDEIYEASVVRFNAWWAWACHWLDTWVWNGFVQLLAYAVLGCAWVNRFFDEYVVNLGFDEGCRRLTRGGSWLSLLHSGRVQNYLRIIGVALAALVLLLIWGCRPS